MALNQSEDRFNGVIASLAIKAPCKTVTDGVGNILLEGEQTINSIAVVAGDRVLVMEQTDPVENGIYNVRTSTWDRAADWDGNRDVVKGTLVTVNRPTNNLTSYVQVNLGVGQDEPTIDVDPVNFVVFFSQVSSLDDLDDVDLTGCSDDDLMYFSGGVLICTLGLLTWDGLDLTIDGNLEMPVLGAPRLINANGSIAAPNVLFNNLDPDSGVVTSLDSMWHVTGGFTAVNYRERSDHVIVTSEAHVGLTASTTQTQAGALELLSSYNRITTVANSGDAVRIPTAFQTLNQGRRMLIINDGAETLQMFPTTDQDIGAGQDQPVDLGAGDSAYFLAVSNSIPSINWRRVFEASVSGGGGGGSGQNGGKSFRTSNTADLTTDVPTVIEFTATAYDTGTFHDTAPLLRSRLTVPASGVSIIVLRCNVTFNSYVSGGKQAFFQKNGFGGPGQIDTESAFLVTPEVGVAGGVGENISVQGTSGQISVDPNDFFEVLAESINQTGVHIMPGSWFELEVIE